MSTTREWPYATAIQMRDYMLTSLAKHCKLTNKPKWCSPDNYFQTNGRPPTELKVIDTNFRIPLAGPDDEKVRNLEELVLDKIYWSSPECSYWVTVGKDIALTIHNCTVSHLEGVQVVALCKRIDCIGIRTVELLWIDHTRKTAQQLSQSTCTEAYRRSTSIVLRCEDMRIYREINLAAHFGITYTPDNITVDIDSDPIIWLAQDLIWKEPVDVLEDFKTWAKLDRNEIEQCINHALDAGRGPLEMPKTDILKRHRVMQFLGRKLNGVGSPLLEVFDKLPLCVLWDGQGTPTLKLTTV